VAVHNPKQVLLLGLCDVIDERTTCESMISVGTIRRCYCGLRVPMLLCYWMCDFGCAAFRNGEYCMRCAGRSNEVRSALYETQTANQNSSFAWGRFQCLENVPTTFLHVLPSDVRLSKLCAVQPFYNINGITWQAKSQARQPRSASHDKEEAFSA
jgi:hypothetical protein